MGVLGVILAILKIIGIILLALLAIVLIVVCVVLFVPFVYSFKIKKYKEITGDVNVSWFFGLIGVWVVIEDGKPVTKVKLMGRDLDEILEKRKNKKKRKKKQKKKGSGKKKKQNKKVTTKEPLVVNPDESAEVAKQVQQKKEATTTEAIKSDDEVPEVATEEDQKESESISPMYKRVKFKKMQVDSSKADSKKDEIIDEKDKEAIVELADEVSDVAEEIIEAVPVRAKIDKDYFINMPFEEKKEVINAVMTLMKRVFAGVLPENVYVNVTIGTGDPQTTGYVLALAGAIKGIIHKEIYVKGKFDETFFEGEVRIEGKIQLIKFVRALIRFILQKPIRKIIIIYWKGRGE